MFGLKGRDTFNKPRSTFEEKMQKFSVWWMKYFSYILLTLFFVALSVIGYIWYEYLYNKEVTEQEKQNYIIQKSNAITFKKEKFETIQQELNSRKEKFDAPRVEYRDIFYKTQIQEDEIMDEDIINIDDEQL